MMNNRKRKDETNNARNNSNENNQSDWHSAYLFDTGQTAESQLLNAVCAERRVPDRYRIQQAAKQPLLGGGSPPLTWLGSLTEAHR
jgi:hypothetical protein